MAGIEPTYKGFADPCLTTWLHGLIDKIVNDKNIKSKLVYSPRIGGGRVVEWYTRNT